MKCVLLLCFCPIQIASLVGKLSSILLRLLLRVKQIQTTNKQRNKFLLFLLFIRLAVFNSEPIPLWCQFCYLSKPPTSQILKLNIRMVHNANNDV